MSLEITRGAESDSHPGTTEPQLGEALLNRFEAVLYRLNNKNYCLSRLTPERTRSLAILHVVDFALYLIRAT